MKRITALPRPIRPKISHRNCLTSWAGHLAQSGQLSLLDRHYLSEMQSENEFLQWDGAPQELARIGQKVGADYLLVGRINDISAASGQQRCTG